MSLDITLMRTYHVSYDNLETWEEKTESVYEDNITHNLNHMADAAGIYGVLWRPDENNLNKASELIPYLETGLEELQQNPEQYETFNPSNGWGSYKGLVKFVEKYLEACRKYPNADVYVSR